MAAVSAPSPNRASWYGSGAGLLLALGTLLIYLPLRDHGFVALDDGDYVKDNRMVQAGLTWAGVKWAFITGHSGNWHPVTWLSHMLDAQLCGPGPRGPHVVNLLLHIANTLLLHGVLRRLTGALWRSVFVAALFALHPLHVESVAWISERKDVLSAFFFLLTLWTYANYAAAAQSRNRISARWYGAALICFALGLMSKPMLVTLPCVLLLLDHWPLSRWKAVSPGRLVFEKLPFFTLSAASCVVTLVMQKRGGAVGSLANYAIDQRIENALVSYARYLGKMVWPADLAVIYPHPGNPPALHLILAALLVAGGCFAAVYWIRKFPFFATGWFWFLGMLVPTIGLVQVGVQSMADRYTYLPSIGLFIVFTWGAGECLARWRHPKTVAATAIGVVVVACALQTRAQVAHWQSSEKLFRHTLAMTAENFAAHNSLGHAYLEEGRVNEAIVEFERTLEIHPAFAEAHNNLGNALLKQARVEQALTQFRKAVEMRPTFALAHYNAGTVLLQTGRIDEAIAALEKAAALRPDDALVHLNLGNAFLQKGQVDAAIARYGAALALEPNADLHNNLGQALLQKGRIEEAFVHFQTAVKIDPAHANAHFVLGEHSLRRARWDEAIVHFQHTLKTQPDDADAHQHLATALREKGQSTEAAVHFEKATRLRTAAAAVVTP